MFNVTKIIDEKTIQVFPRWKWGTYAGDTVTIRGLEVINDLNREFSKLLVKSRLEGLLLNTKPIELFAPIELMPNDPNNIKCEVRLDNVNIKNYFPETTQKS